LGDLDSDEAELFQLLLVANPALQDEVAALRDALSVMPYGLADVDVDSQVRSQLLAKTEAELELHQADPYLTDATVTDTTVTDAIVTGTTTTEADVSLGDHTPSFSAKPSAAASTFPSPTRSRLPWLVSGLAAVCGVAALQLNSQVRLLQAQTVQTTDPVSVVQTWSGLDDILQDHQKSIQNPDGPVDFVVGRPSDVLDLLSGFQTTVAALPILPQGTLIGGSNCQFGKTQGLRLTYQLATNQTVSAYQLDLAGQTVPTLQSAQLTLQQADGTGMVLWRNANYLYVLVAALPIPELQTLAHAIGDP